VRQIEGLQLWLGNVGDVEDLEHLFEEGIQAVVDLSLIEAPAKLSRDLVYCRFPLLDGIENDRWLLAIAIQTVSRLIQERVPTLVYCTGGMSRTPAICAKALAIVRGCELNEALKLVTNAGPVDISPGLWKEVVALETLRGEDQNAPKDQS
jgi:protein-tyrosine phosphatase